MIDVFFRLLLAVLGGLATFEGCSLLIVPNYRRTKRR